MGDVIMIIEEQMRKIEVSQELLQRANSVREYVAACNAVVKELIDRGVEIEYYFQGNKLPEGYFGMDFEIRMILPLDPVQL